MQHKRIAIIGAGPIGLEAALYGRALGHDVTVFDRGPIAANLIQWGFVQLFTPWRMNATPLGLRALQDSARWREPLGDVCPSGAELRDRYLLPLADSPLLSGRIQQDISVQSIGREDDANTEGTIGAAAERPVFRLLLSDSSGNESVHRADVVLDCSGTYGHHRWAGRGGIPAPGERALGRRIWYLLPDVLGRHRSRFANRDTLLIGSGFSAATVLHGVERLQRSYAGTRLTWIIRRPGQALRLLEDDPLPARRNLVAASMRLIEHPPAWLRFMPHCTVESFACDPAAAAPAGQPATGGAEAQPQIQVTLKFADTQLTVRADEIVALVGYGPDDAICVGAKSDGAASGFCTLGAKSYGTNSAFLLQFGHQQIRDAFRLIEADQALDLYQQKTPTHLA